MAAPRRLRLLQTLEGHEVRAAQPLLPKPINLTVPTQDRVWCCAWAPSGAALATCGGDRTVRLWAPSGEPPAWRCVATLEELHSRTVRACAWAPCGTLLATASFDGSVGVWEVREGEWACVATLEGHENEVKCVAWSRCGTRLATCGRDKAVWVWEAAEGSGGPAGGDFECLAVLQGHTADVKHVAWHPDGERLFSCSYDDSIRVWAPEPGGDDWGCLQALPGAVQAGKEAAAAARNAAKSGGAEPEAVAAAAAAAQVAAAAACGGHAGSVWALAFSPDGTRLASVSDDGSLRLWSSAHNRPAAFAAAVPGAHSRTVFSVDWAPDGDALVTGGGDNAIRVWAPGSDGATLVAEHLEAHPADVNCTRWRPRCPGMLASAGDDGSVRLWALE